MTTKDEEQKKEIVFAIKDKAYEKGGLLSIDEFAELANNMISKG